FSNSLGNEFIVDDSLFIVDWPLIQDLNNFPEFFGPHNQPVGEEGVYSPLKTCLHAFNYNMWGLNVFGHHVVGLLIHLIGTIFVFKIALRLTANVPAAFLCGLFFGIHPVHVEAITPPTGSVDTSGVVWFFASFYFYTKVGSIKGKWDKNYFLAVLFALLAIFTHELVITLPLFLLFYELCFNGSCSKKRSMFFKTLPFFIVSFIYAVLKFSIAGSLARGIYLFGSFYLTMLVVIKALAKYVVILFYPIVLTSNHEISPGIFSVNWHYFDKTEVLMQSILDPQVMLSLFFTAAIIIVGIKFYKINKVVSFCVGWFYISLLPVMNFIPTECYFAERYLYPGSLAFCLLLSLMILAPFNHKNIFSKNIFKFLSILALIFYIGFFFKQTLMRNEQIKNDFSLYKAEARVNPRHPIMHRKLGFLYLRNGEAWKAIEELEIVVKLRPNDPDAHFVLAESYMEVNNFKKAMLNFEKATEIDPNFAESYYNLAGIYAFLGKEKEARMYLGRALTLYRANKRDNEAEKLMEAFYVFWGYK
ncbi:MAG: tetratricopeptide repeat protein, partial [Candidatus Omnitrophica bacterium]|nr:tetratricopeptide repeat protein [Candidatus Omnitrophota bacterium]